MIADPVRAAGSFADIADIADERDRALRRCRTAYDTTLSETQRAADDFRAALSLLAAESSAAAPAVTDWPGAPDNDEDDLQSRSWLH